jgi:hypothetical protein
MKLLGQKRHPQLEGVEPLTGTTNYLLGNNSRHITNISSFKRVRYSEIYPGVDVEYHGNGRLLEYDFVLKPGSRSEKIRMAFPGVRDISVDSSGDLVLQTATGSMVQRNRMHFSKSQVRSVWSMPPMSLTEAMSDSKSALMTRRSR